MHDRHLALAGLFQAAGLVQQLASEGRPEPDAFTLSIRSIFTLSAASARECYGGEISGLERGRGWLQQALAQDRSVAPIVRYALTLAVLERKLARSRELLHQIQQGIAAAERQREHLGADHEQVIERLATVYHDTVSTLRPRILVHGNPLYLQQQQVVHRIRALLLAGMRSAVLWRQLGGRRWQLVFRRNAILRDLEFWPGDDGDESGSSRDAT
ncbi:MAG: high frequency lysogenization protein HflD [Pseudomonadota bacterium]